MTPPNDPNLDGLERVVAALGELIDELVLVGGTAAGLLITDPGAEPVRPTTDVDVIVEASTLAELESFHRELRRRGFHEGGRKGDPICRWRHGELVLDLLPHEESVLGFTNRWYRAAFDRALVSTLPSGIAIRHIDGPHFVATKLEAYAGRGGGISKGLLSVLADRFFLEALSTYFLTDGDRRARIVVDRMRGLSV